MGAEPGRPNELSPITRIDTARVRPVQSAAGHSFIEPGSPWQNPFVESFGSRVRTRCSRSRHSTPCSRRKRSSLTGEPSTTTGGHTGAGQSGDALSSAQ
jgi:hypothetical protein